MKVCSVCQRCFEDSARSCSEAHHEALTEGRAGNCQIIANYRIEFLHESAPTGETYRAVNTIVNKPYLIKILAPELFTAEQGSKETFLRETRALSSVVHPNVARVFESGTLADGAVYVVAEFLTAESLRDCLTERGAPSEVTALTIARQAAEGLEAIHAVGVRHKNICPENIVLTSDAENPLLIKLQNIDFGGIRQKSVISNLELNAHKLRYFSPEQCAAYAIDAQTDVYALGIVLYEALAGKTPFAAPNAGVLIKQQINEPPPPVEIHSFDIRMLLTHTLTDALQKTTRLRLKSASVFARRLRHIEQLATHSPTPPPALAYPAAMNKSAIRFTPPPKIEKRAALENKTAFENSNLGENQPIANSRELPVKAFDDYTTTKLPPLESIIENHLPAAQPNAQTAAIFAGNAENSKLDGSKEAALIEWEQPDDIPSKPQILPPAINQTAATVLIDEDLIDAGDIDAAVNPVSEIDLTGRRPAPRPLSVYQQTVRSWNLPDKRKLLTGAGLAALFVFAIGGTLLSRQFQLVRDGRETTAQSSPNGKSLPKSAESDKVSDTDKSSSVKPLNISNPVLNSDDPDPSDISDSDLRDLNEKNVVPVSQKSINKKVSKETSEKRREVPNKTVSNEPFNKKTEAGSLPDKKTAVKDRNSTAAKPEIITRPRIVRNPKF